MIEAADLVTEFNPVKHHFAAVCAHKRASSSDERACRSKACHACAHVHGTGSDVGKSLIVAGLCRLFTNRGLRVRPFKPQNMSNNAAVTADGG